MAWNLKHYGLFVVVIVLPVLFGIFLGTGLFRRSTGARLALDRLEYDMGVLSYDENKTVTVQFQNSGNKPLRIRRIYTGCNCTSSRIEQDTWLPGEIGTFEVTYHALGLPGTEIDWPIHVFSNDSSLSVATITLLGRMKASLVVVPHKLALGGCAPRAAVSRHVVVTDLGVPRGALDIEQVDVNLPGATVLVRPATADDDVPAQVVSSHTVYAVVLSLFAPASPGRFHGEIRIRATTDGRDRRTLLVPVAGEVRPSINVDPPHLVRIHRHAGKSRKLRLKDLRPPN